MVPLNQSSVDFASAGAILLLSDEALRSLELARSHEAKATEHNPDPQQEPDPALHPERKPKWPGPDTPPKGPPGTSGGPPGDPVHAPVED